MRWVSTWSPASTIANSPTECGPVGQREEISINVAAALGVTLNVWQGRPASSLPPGRTRPRQRHADQRTRI
jgi:hypothetical protein